MIEAQISTERYDEIWEISDRIYESCQKNQDSPYFEFFMMTSYPRVQDMEQYDIENHLQEFLPYLLFYYNEPIPELAEDPDYVASMKYIRELMKKGLQFVDEKYVHVTVSKDTLRQIKRGEQKEVFLPMTAYWATRIATAGEDDVVLRMEDPKELRIILSAASVKCNVYLHAANGTESEAIRAVGTVRLTKKKGDNKHEKAKWYFAIRFDRLAKI